MKIDMLVRNTSLGCRALLRVEYPQTANDDVTIGYEGQPRISVGREDLKKLLAALEGVLRAYPLPGDR